MGSEVGRREQPGQARIDAGDHRAGFGGGARRQAAEGGDDVEVRLGPLTFGEVVAGS